MSIMAIKLGILNSLLAGFRKRHSHVFQLPLESFIDHIDLPTMSSTKNLFSALTLEDPTPKPKALQPKKKGKKKQTILSLYEPPAPAPAPSPQKHLLRSTLI